MHYNNRNREKRPIRRKRTHIGKYMHTPWPDPREYPTEFMKENWRRAKAVNRADRALIYRLVVDLLDSDEELRANTVFHVYQRIRPNFPRFWIGSGINLVDFTEYPGGQSIYLRTEIKAVIRTVLRDLGYHIRVDGSFY